MEFCNPTIISPVSLEFKRVRKKITRDAREQVRIPSWANWVILSTDSESDRLLVETDSQGSFLLSHLRSEPLAPDETLTLSLPFLASIDAPDPAELEFLCEIVFSSSPIPGSELLPTHRSGNVPFNLIQAEPATLVLRWGVGGKGLHMFRYRNDTNAPITADLRSLSFPQRDAVGIDRAINKGDLGVLRRLANTTNVPPGGGSFQSTHVNSFHMFELNISPTGLVPSSGNFRWSVHSNRTF